MGVSRTLHLWIGDGELARMGTSEYAAWWHGLAVNVFSAGRKRFGAGFCGKIPEIPATTKK